MPHAPADWEEEWEEEEVAPIVNDDPATWTRKQREAFRASAGPVLGRSTWRHMAALSRQRAVAGGNIA